MTPGPVDLDGGRQSPLSTVLALVPAALVMLTVAIIQLETRSGAGGYDAIADWVIVNAALDGLNLGDPIVDMAARYGVDLPALEGQADATHPRTPGGLLLLAWLAALDVGMAYPVMLSINVVATLALLWWVCRSFDIRPVDALLAAVFIVASGFMYGALEFGAISPLIALLVFAYWRSLAIGRRGALGGIAVGVAAALKVFPVLFLAAAARQRRWATAAWSAGAVLVLSLTAFAIFDLGSLASTISQLSLASEQWVPFGGNLSIGGLLTALGVQSTVAVGIAAVLGLTWVSLNWQRMRGVDATMALISVAILVSWPMVWGHYMIIATPALAVFWRSGGVAARRLVSIWLVAWVVIPALILWTEGPPMAEQVALAALQLLLVAAVHTLRGGAVIPNGRGRRRLPEGDRSP